MAHYRDGLPQLGGDLFLTDGGMETTLIFHEGLDLPHFAAFVLLRDGNGRAALRDYYARYMALAREHATGFILESPTWRASPDWAERLGYSLAELDAANREAIDLMAELRARHGGTAPVVVSGCVGPRGDGYDPGTAMEADEAADYHATQIASFADSAADMVTAITMTNASEATGVVHAATAAGMPVAISFTVETDGRLPTGQRLGEAIGEVDDETDGAAAYFMINCAHPSHFADTLAGGGRWLERIRGLRANSSRKSHAELDESETLDEGNPDELGAEHGALKAAHPHINVFGGCCGTDHRHVEQICAAVQDTRKAA